MTDDPDSVRDARFLSATIRLGRREIGRTWPNPAVGALIVANRGGSPVVVGRGWTRPGGRPHAETIALDQAGGAARGATAYVSLEPCAHHGRTGPCVEALIAAGIARVVTPLDDPDPRVAGKGHQALRAAGIEVVTGIAAEAARLAHAGHIMRHSAGRPFVTLKLAISRDGHIAGPDRRPMAITGAQAQAWAHMLRATHDAILVGIGTALADDPVLTCRLPGMADWSPVRVVLDSRLRLPPGAKMLDDVAVAPLWLVAREDADAKAAATLEGAGAEVLRVADGADGRVDLASALAALAGRGITRLLVEGGADVAGALLAADLVDEAVIFESDLEIGPGGLPAIAGAGLAAITAGAAYRRVDARPVGPDRMAVFRRER